MNARKTWNHAHTCCHGNEHTTWWVRWAMSSAVNQEQKLTTRSAWKWGKCLRKDFDIKEWKAQEHEEQETNRRIKSQPQDSMELQQTNRWKTWSSIENQSCGITKPQKRRKSRCAWVGSSRRLATGPGEYWPSSFGPKPPRLHSNNATCQPVPVLHDFRLRNSVPSAVDSSGHWQNVSSQTTGPSLRTQLPGQDVSVLRHFYPQGFWCGAYFFSAGWTKHSLLHCWWDYSSTTRLALDAMVNCLVWQHRMLAITVFHRILHMDSLLLSVQDA